MGRRGARGFQSNEKNNKEKNHNEKEALGSKAPKGPRKKRANAKALVEKQEVAGMLNLEIKIQKCPTVPLSETELKLNPVTMPSALWSQK